MFWGELLRKETFRVQSRRGEVNNKMSPNEGGWEDVNWIRGAQERNK
jgi:hypothetical protein